jgi:integrase
VIRVSRVLTQGMEKPEEGTKTSAGLRDVQLLEPAYQALIAQKAFTFIQGAAIFHDPRTAQRWTDRSIREKMWQPALRRAKVRYRRPYQTRHTYASMMLVAGENPMWVAKQMGHTDWSLTAKRYARWIPSDMPEAGRKAVGHFGHNSVTVPLQIIERRVPEGGLEPPRD